MFPQISQPMVLDDEPKPLLQLGLLLEDPVWGLFVLELPVGEFAVCELAFC